MEIYKQMYLRLFNRVTDAVEFLKGNCPAEAEKILILAQQECEEMFMESEE